jgi:hypothetical protein
MRTTTVVLGLGWVLAMAGCQAKGTCVIVQTDDAPPREDSCWLSYEENACTESGHQDGQESTFYVEDPIAGMARCKAEGFAERTGGPPPAEGQSVVLHRAHAGEPK